MNNSRSFGRVPISAEQGEGLGEAGSVNCAIQPRCRLSKAEGRASPAFAFVLGGPNRRRRLSLGSVGFADHHHLDFHHNVGVRRHRHCVLAHHLQRAIGHANLSLGHGQIDAGQRFSNVVVGH
jgi:hypothetical protein